MAADDASICGCSQSGPAASAGIGLCPTDVSVVGSVPVRCRRVSGRGAPRRRRPGVDVIPTTSSRTASNADGCRPRRLRSRRWCSRHPFPSCRGMSPKTPSGWSGPIFSAISGESCWGPRKTRRGSKSLIRQEKRVDFPREPRKTSRPVKSLTVWDFATDFPTAPCKT